ncbi:MAG: phage terminase small subunit P27 family [Acidobacteria bacterium]|nr:phage terminase small subunit P27 family [Acidobacteriota bacterium]
MGQRGTISDAALRFEQGLAKEKPRPPANMSKESKREWERITTLLETRGLLDRLDEAGLHDYLTCWERLRECEALLTREGLVATAERGTVKHPAATLASQYRASLLAWSKELGLTLASRLRMQVERNLSPEARAHDPYGLLD